MKIWSKLFLYYNSLVTHSKQVAPATNAEPPLVCTGAEWIIPQISSSKFVHTAKDDGVVLDIVPNETMTVQYKNGDKITLDILPRLSRTKRGAYISLEMKPLEIGTKFKKNQLLASTENFDNKTNSYTAGKNVKVAVMSYLGFTYEDGYAISSKICQDSQTSTVKELSVIVPQETKVFELEKEIGKVTKPGDVLINFAYDEDLSNYLLANDLDIEDDDSLVESLGNKNNGITLKSPGGKIVDIKVFVNDKLKMDSSLIKFHKELVERSEDIRTRLEKGKHTPYEKLTAGDNLNTAFYKIGDHKQKGNVFRGIRVVYYIKRQNHLEKVTRLHQDMELKL